MKTQSFAKNHKHQVVLKSKIHFKLYKKGKSWLITGLSLSLFGGVLLLDQQKVFADSSTSQTASSADSASEQSNKSETVQNPNITPSNSNGSSNQPATGTSDTASSTYITSTTTSTGPNEVPADKSSGQHNSSPSTEPSATSESNSNISDNSGVENNQSSTPTDLSNVSGTASSPNATNTEKNQSYYASTVDTALGTQLTDEINDASNANNLAKTQVSSAWDDGYTGKGMVIAVIDLGFNPNNDNMTLDDPDSAAISQTEAETKISNLGYGVYENSKVPFFYNYVDNSDTETNDGKTDHGMMVSGVVAADKPTSGTSQYMLGTAPEAQLLMMRVVDEFPNEQAEDVARAIRDAVYLGADVITLSVAQGIPSQSDTDLEQSAIQYAIDTGVFVSVAAANNGDSASDASGASTGLDDNGSTESQPVTNGGAIADPGISQNAMTVAAETNSTNLDSADLTDSLWTNMANVDTMAYFSSNGPTSDFTLKPDISSPGWDVQSLSLQNTNSFDGDSGTSFATPYLAGLATLVLQKLKGTTSLQGADLVRTAKLILKNTADPMEDVYYPGNYVSPRKEGAGQVNAAAAMITPVVINTADGSGSVSLKQIADNTTSETFNLTFTNLSNTTASYTFNNYGGVMTNAIDGVHTYDVYDSDASIDTDTDEITLQAGETKTLTFTLTIDSNQEKDKYLEGFLGFTSTDGNPDLVVPYMGYYGDSTDEDVFDAKIGSSESIFDGGYLTDTNNYPLGVTDKDSLEALVTQGSDGYYSFTTAAELSQDSKTAISPNGDNNFDNLSPLVYTLQNLKDLKAEVVDANGNIVRIIADQQDVDKSNNDGDDPQDIRLGIDMQNDQTLFNWDGTIYNQLTGEYETAPDGQYTYELVGTLVNDGANQVQTLAFPVKVDTVAPSLSATYDASTHTISGTYSDTGVGFTDYSNLELQINDQSYAINLKGTFSNDSQTQGNFSFSLTDAELSALATATPQVTLSLADTADNKTTILVDSPDDTSKNTGIAIWNAINGQPFDTSSSDYNATSNTFDLKGSSNSPFYLDGTLVTPINGTFNVQVDADSTLNFTSDAAGTNLIRSFTHTSTEPFLQWQKLGETFDITHQASKYVTNQKQITIKALVNDEPDVKVYVLGMTSTGQFTQIYYPDSVEDGVATFTFDLGDSTALYGSVVVDTPGPSANDGLTYTSQGKYSIFSGENIDIQYDADAPDFQTASTEAELGTASTTSTQTDPTTATIPSTQPGFELADATYYATPNSDIHFDNLNDMNTVRYGQDAITDGYYDPATEMFTITGTIDSAATDFQFHADDLPASEKSLTVNPDGTFVYKIHMDPTSERNIGYSYVANRKTVVGDAVLILDTSNPDLELDNTSSWTDDGDNTYEVTSYDPTFTLSGTAYDNLDDYALTINGNNIYREQHNTGVDYISDFYKSADGTILSDDTNPYTPVAFTNTYKLIDNPDSATNDNTFLITLTDQVGNTVTKKVIVHYVSESRFQDRWLAEWTLNHSAPTVTNNDESIQKTNSTTDTTRGSINNQSKRSASTKSNKSTKLPANNNSSSKKKSKHKHSMTLAYEDGNYRGTNHPRVLKYSGAQRNFQKNGFNSSKLTDASSVRLTTNHKSVYPDATGTKGQSNQSELPANRLPQTSETATPVAALIGTILLSISTLVGLASRSKHREH
ncbi:S8 family serine peptidase [Secundilactobacillus collinoides]|uniref:Cell-envelope associated proteinase n=2 Tax=Secundilactobacillus collinoides TaxID=33960 RepID=A0A0R2B669_SECCO|nr:S8 family serine peptidase [Secundilactobacillus collinoides]KRM74554.1 cell-envelope associated proteinase [Secundilactobacillus collinoides DSM 20515 = JCM 1123]